jgi:hypothetical protein
MTRVDADLLFRITQALRSTGPAEKTERRSASSTTATTASRRKGTRANQLREILDARIRQLDATEPLTDDDVLVMAIQETLVLEFGSEIALHPRFNDVVERVRATLSGLTPPQTFSVSSLTGPASRPD